MFVRVGTQIVSGEDQVIMVYLTEKDKKNIADMAEDCNVYCEIPDDVPDKYIKNIKMVMKMFKEAVKDELGKRTKNSSDSND